MSWVFLADGLAYKLKKPVKWNSFDWRSVDSRREDCEREVKLNRRLAKGVYHGVVPLAIDARGGLQLEGDGEAVDWLVKMRRLPESLMLDWLLEHQDVNEAKLRRAIAVLSHFYQQSPAFDITGRRYCKRLAEDLAQSRHELSLPQYEQSGELVRRVHDALLRYVEQESSLLEARVHERHVIDAHGDLRPEHICLEPQPVIIDCLQFDQRLRILDTASELSFLALECQRLGAEDFSKVIWPVYHEICGDEPPLHLLLFYNAYHACLRAMVSVWHLKDHVQDATKWTRRGHAYMQAAESAVIQLLKE